MADTAPETVPKKNRWLLPAVLLVLAVIGAGSYFAWQLMRGGKPAASPPPAPIFMALEPFTVNLQPGAAQRHLHAVISVRVQDAATQTLMNQYLPEVRSRVLGVLSNREGPALMEPAAREDLAEDIEQVLQRPLHPQHPPARILDVVFTTFLLQ